MSIQSLNACLDLKQNLNIVTACKQFDSLNLILSIFDNSMQADLTNYDVRLRAMKADQVPLIQEHVGLEINNNQVNIDADEQLTTTAGNTFVELQFINKTTDEKKATFNLALKVFPSTVNVNGTISTATYTLLEELENKIDQCSDFFEHIGEAIEANTNLINSTNTANETKEALDGSNTTALATKSALDTSNTNATNTKNALDALKTSADNTKNALNTVNQTGQTLLDSLETFEQEHADVTDISNQLANVNTQLSTNTNDIKFLEENKLKFAFGVVGDGTTDDTITIQSAFDSLNDGDSIFFPTSFAGYKITSPILITKNDIKVYSNIKAEYSTAIIASNSSMSCIFDVRGYGFSVKNLNFKQDGFSIGGGNPATVDGIHFIMEHAGTPSTSYEVNANVDCEVSNCGFFNLQTSIIGTGRNMNIHDNIFSNSNKGIKINLFPNSDCRGHRIYNNRFHTIGYDGSLNSLVSDSCCIELPYDNSSYVYGQEIHDNFADICTIFIKGNINGSKIKDNYCYRGYGGLIDTQIQGSTLLDGKSTQIEGNFYTGNLIIINDSNKNNMPIVKEAEYGINLNNLSNVYIKNNIINNVLKDGINTSNMGYVYMENNTIVNPDMCWYRSGVHNYCGIRSYNTLNLFTKNNFIRSTKTSNGESNVKYGIFVDGTALTNLYMDNNNILDFVSGETYTNNCSFFSSHNETEYFKKALKFYIDSINVIEQTIGFERKNSNAERINMFSVGVTNASLNKGAEKSIVSFKNMCNGILTELIKLNFDKTIQIGDGTWNGSHIIMGSSHLWIDNGTLRIKSSAPTSATDGVTVGSQT
ncbi:hypothetical protein [Clostridium beijerinckii]|uniref:hypothetical protein n=1 Tax=Clostridium beijerinckii TaxID=1520 RepID=UPI00232FAEAE|nr:hypothetical protein [Clostridium beijerinckii]